MKLGVEWPELVIVALLDGLSVSLIHLRGLMHIGAVEFGGREAIQARLQQAAQLEHVINSFWCRLR